MKTTYEQIYAKVMPHLINYKDDLLVHDLKILDNYNGKFIYGYRHCGTDLLKLLPDFESYAAGFTKRHYSNDEIEKWLLEEIIWITYPDRNTQFLYFDGVKLHTITRERANLLHRDHVSNICRTYHNKLSLAAL